MNNENIIYDSLFCQENNLTEQIIDYNNDYHESASNPSSEEIAHTDSFFVKLPSEIDILRLAREDISKFGKR